MLGVTVRVLRGSATRTARTRTDAVLIVSLRRTRWAGRRIPQSYNNVGVAGDTIKSAITGGPAAPV